MSGRMVQRGENLTISVELVDIRNNTLIWGEKYDRKMSELLATQKEIATEITNKLRLKLSGESEQKLTKKYTDNNEAYELYLKGRFFWNKRDEENLRKAIEEFKAAADQDPNFALAYVGLADSYVLLPFYSAATSAEVTPPAKAYAERALAIDSSLGEAHSSLGYVDRLLWNWTEAEKELKRRIELNPNYATAHKWYGNVLFDTSLTFLGVVYVQTGRRGEAEAVLKELKQKYTEHKANGYDIARIYAAMGDKDQAFEWLEKDFQSHNATMPDFLSMPPLTSLHDDPRYMDLIKRLGLPEWK